MQPRGFTATSGAADELEAQAASEVWPLRSGEDSHGPSREVEAAAGPARALNFKLTRKGAGPRLSQTVTPRSLTRSLSTALFRPDLAAGK
jgi:hypothetical protein